MNGETRTISELEAKILGYLESECPGSLVQHLKGVRDFALEMNRVQSLGIEEKKIIYASLLHDIVRHHSPEKLRLELLKYEIDPDSFGFAAPILLHAELGAVIAQREFGINDTEILSAIRKHATGCREMSLLDTLIFVADKVEPGRNYPGANKLREIAMKDIFEAVLPVIKSSLIYLIEAGHPIDYNSIDLYNTLTDSGLNRRG